MTHKEQNIKLRACLQELVGIAENASGITHHEEAVTQLARSLLSEPVSEGEEWPSEKEIKSEIEKEYPSFGNSSDGYDVNDSKEGFITGFYYLKNWIINNPTK